MVRPHRRMVLNGYGGGSEMQPKFRKVFPKQGQHHLSSFVSLLAKLVKLVEENDAPDDVVVVKNALKYLRKCLLRGSGGKRKDSDHDLRQQVYQVDGPVIIAEAMTRYKQNKDVCSIGCWVLGYLATDQEIAEYIASDFCLDAIVASMKQYPKEIPLQQSACYALRNISSHDGNSSSSKNDDESTASLTSCQQAVIRSGAIQQIVMAMMCHPREIRILLHASHVLNRIANSGSREGNDAIALCGGRKLISKYAEEFQKTEAPMFCLAEYNNTFQRLTSDLDVKPHHSSSTSSPGKHLRRTNDAALQHFLRDDARLHPSQRNKERQKRRATHTGSRGFSDYFEKRIDDEEGEQQQEWKQRGVTLEGGVDDTVDRMFWFMDEWEQSDACTM